MAKTPPVPEIEKDAPECRLLMAAGDKGSSGKSTALACIIEWLRLRAPHLPMTVFDPDTKHRTMTKIFGPAGTTPMVAPNRLETVDWTGSDREREPQMDDIVRAFGRGEQSARISIVDGVANQFEDMMIHWLDNVRLFELSAEFGFRVTFLIVQTEVQDSLTQATKLVKAIGNRADFLVVRNMKVQRCLPWDNDGATEVRRLVLGELGGKQVDLEGFSMDQVKLVDAQSSPLNYTIKQLAMTAADGGPADSFTRNRAVSTWARTVAQLDGAASVILPPSEKLILP